MYHYTTEIFAQIFTVFVSVYSLRKKSVSISGFISMLVVATFFIWNNGIAPLIILFAMYASASLLTRYKQQDKSVLTNDVLKKHGPRDFVQAICNLGVAFACFILYVYTNNPAYLLALIGSVAASNADSWASEIGVLSKQRPVMITTFKPCKPGISGGVTWLGTCAGIAGSIFIAIVAMALKSSMALEISYSKLFWVVSLSGTVGLLLDSLLGATVQIVYKNEQAEETENPETSIGKERGINWINNDVVNFLNSLVIAVLVFLSN